MNTRRAQIIAAVSGIVLCGVFDIFAGAAMLVSFTVIFVLQYFSEKKRREKILFLCDEIDKILHGGEKINLDDYSEGELSILSSEIRKMTVKLREQNILLKKEKILMKTALEDMSHQLRTPLTTMALINEMLKNTDLPKRERICRIREMGSLLEHMKWIIETMLKISRMEAGAVRFAKERFKVSELIKAACGTLEISLELKGITLETETEGTPEFYADKKYCAEALANILKNCMEHTPEGGVIRIRTVSNAVYDGIIISDTGSGFSEEELPHIFDRFYHTDKKSGFGIGLSFARSVIALQGGSLNAANNIPCGAVFDWRMFVKTEDA